MSDQDELEEPNKRGLNLAKSILSESTRATLASMMGVNRPSTVRAPSVPIYEPQDMSDIQLPPHIGAADRVAEDQLEASQGMLDAVRANLALSEQARADAQRSERATRITAVVSVVLSAASLGVAVLALFLPR